MSRSRWPDARGAAPALGLVGLGAAGVVASLGFGTPALMPLGIGLALIGLVAVTWVGLAARGVTVVRTVAPTRLPAGGRCVVSTRLHGRPGGRGLLRLLDRQVDTGPLPAPARVAREPHGGAVVSGLPRGVHRLGSAEVVLGDPLGLVRRGVPVPGGATVTVLAPRVALDTPFWEVAAAGDRAGERARRGSRDWAELEGVRDYRPGDPLSRVHWGQTAKRGTLQTKELVGDDGRGRGIVVLLDARSDPAQGAGPAAPFEVAVAAAASLCAHLAGGAVPAGLVAHAARAVDLPDLGAGRTPAEDALAAVTADGPLGAAAALRALARSARPPRLVALCSAAPDADLEEAVGRAVGEGMAVAVLLAGPVAAARADSLRAAGAAVSTALTMEGLTAALSPRAVPRAA